MRSEVPVRKKMLVRYVNAELLILKREKGRAIQPLISTWMAIRWIVHCRTNKPKDLRGLAVTLA